MGKCFILPKAQFTGPGKIMIYCDSIFKGVYTDCIKDNCFTILCWFLPYIIVNQPYVYTCPLPPSSHPSRLGCQRARTWAPCVLQQLPTGSLFYTRQCVCFGATLWIRPMLSISSWVISVITAGVGLCHVPCHTYDRVARSVPLLSTQSLQLFHLLFHFHQEAF